MTSIFICNTNRKLTIVTPLVLFYGSSKSVPLNHVPPLLPGYRALANISKFTFVICHVVFTTMT